MDNLMKLLVDNAFAYTMDTVGAVVVVVVESVAGVAGAVEGMLLWSQISHHMTAA